MQPNSEAQDFANLFGGHFPGHTMQRLRTPEGKYRYSYVSPEVIETFGLDPEDLMQRDMVAHEWVHHEDRLRFVEALERSAKELSILDEEVRVEISPGGYKWVRSIGHPRRLEDGTVIWDGIALDVTDRREAREALERALKQTRIDEVSDKRFAAIAARDVVRPFERLSDAIRMLDNSLSKNGTSANPEAAAEVVEAFDHFAVAFNAARGLVTAGKPREMQQTDPDPSELHALTKRQRDVLELLKRGLSNRDIAKELGIGEGTVKLHVSAILRATGVKNRTMAASLFADND
ncbi:MAG: LuxR C-terminal-related transcriptional regulator [Pseudomonadota bacterium]